jgi:hypothetical protein
MRRGWLLFCLAAMAGTFFFAHYEPYQLDGDAVSYMDLGDLIRGHQWHAIVNAYWHPLYPALLALGHALFRSTRYNELAACYVINLFIFLLEMLAIVVFVDALSDLRHKLLPTSTSVTSFLLDRDSLRYLALTLLLIASQRELSPGKVRPDALLQALLLFALAALLKHLATGLYRYTALMGLALGLAYLTKSFAFIFTLCCLLVLVLFRILWQRTRLLPVVAASLVLLCCFGVVAGPYVAALSHQKGRLTFGDSGSLNYAWYVSGTEKVHLEPSMTASFGSADVQLKHPEQQLLESPGINRYSALANGTYPPWFDPTYWNDHIRTRFSLSRQLPRAGRNLVLVARYLLNHPEGLVLFALLFLLGSSLRLRLASDAFWLPPVALGLAVWLIYGIVNIEERYVTIGFLAILLPLFAALRVKPSSSSSRPSIAMALILFFALLTTAESFRLAAEERRQFLVAHYPAPWYEPDDFAAAHALNALGIGPGDNVACIISHSHVFVPYFARLAGVRILTELYVPKGPLYPFLAALPNREEALDTLRRTGDKALIGYFDPGAMTGTTPASAGWHQLANTHFYVYPLNPPTLPEQVPHQP